MTDETNNQSTSSKFPYYIAYSVREREGKKNFWTRIGIASQHKDGEGFTIDYDALPLNGQIVVRRAPDKKE